MSITHVTLTFTQLIEARLPVVWGAFSDSTQRALWSVPAGEAMVFDESSFQVGGRDKYRCGPPETLEFHGTVGYLQILPRSLVVHTDTVAAAGRILAVALLTWEFEDHGDSTRVRLTDQVTSFIGIDMIDGHRNGHTKALKQLRNFVEETIRA